MLEPSVSDKERQLREKIASGSQNPDDYTALAGWLYEARRFDESLQVLREALRLPLPDLRRADLLTLLGCCVYNGTYDANQAASLGEQAIALTQGTETIAALSARAFAQSLIANCSWTADSVRAAQTANSALSLFGQVLERRTTLDEVAIYEIHLEAARLNGLLERTEEATRQCKEALALASDKNQRVICMTELGTIHRTAGHLAEARGVFVDAIKSVAAAPHLLFRPYYELGLVEKALGKLPEARAKFRRALGIFEDDPNLPCSGGYLPGIMQEIAEISRDLGDHGGAAKAFQALVDFYPPDQPMHWACLHCLSDCQRELGQLGIAATNLERIVESTQAPIDQRDKARSALQSMRGHIAESHYDRKEYAACIAACESLLPQIEESHVWRPALLELLGHSYLATRKNPQARKYYEAVIASPGASTAQRENAKRGLSKIQC